MSALGEAFKAHTVGFLVAGVLVAGGAFSTLTDIFQPQAKEMTCTVSEDANVSSKMTFGIGFEQHTPMAVPADQLAKMGSKPVIFDCVAK